MSRHGPGTVERDGHVYGWCLHCLAWWRMVGEVVRSHMVLDGEVHRVCPGGDQPPTEPVRPRSW